MTQPRFRRFAGCLALAAALAVAAGCDTGRPERASDIQNLNGITDDISAVRRTESQSRYARDPNTISTIPRNYEVRDHP